MYGRWVLALVAKNVGLCAAAFFVFFAATAGARVIAFGGGGALCGDGALGDGAQVVHGPNGGEEVVQAGLRHGCSGIRE